MLRIRVDFNELTPDGKKVLVARHTDWDLISQLQPGMRVILYEPFELAVKAIAEPVEHSTGKQLWYGIADWSTQVDFEEISDYLDYVIDTGLPPVEVLQELIVEVKRILGYIETRFDLLSRHDFSEKHRREIADEQIPWSLRAVNGALDWGERYLSSHETNEQWKKQSV